MEPAILDRPPSLTDAVVAHIRDGIIAGSYAPGQPLTELQLSDELGTSRGTVREALRGTRQPRSRDPHDPPRCGGLDPDPQAR